MRRAIAALVAVVLVLPLASCAGPVEGTPRARSGGTTPASTERSGAPVGTRAPRVAEPLTPDPYVADACRAIPAERAGPLDLATPGRKATNAASSGCLWFTTDRQFSVAVGYMTALEAGLSEIYAQHARNPTVFKYFEPTDVTGYPALFADKIDERERGECLLNIGVTDDLYMFVAANHLPRGKNVCELAAQVGAAVVATMKKGA
ncbi:DUF3558 domain-containing protein [Actinosynnema sp. NPDC023587]|uniref:DUF3558 domain-containing protein n=1 Tax=Actinosynnema sp. NPDC023587 TaxID=3154695 RepID=UPI0034105334